jgi:hypothetical protein
VTVEKSAQSVLDGAVDEPSCEDPAKDDALAEAEVTPNQDTTEPESNNNNDEVIDLQTPMPAMSDADMFDGELDDEFLDDHEVSCYTTASQADSSKLDRRDKTTGKHIPDKSSGS